MSLFRHVALPVYRWATRSQRETYRRSFSASRQWPAAILFYHRVADYSLDNGWTIRSERFSEQLDWVDSIAEFASLDAIRLDQRSKARDRLKVSITFDDGYGDNLEWAIPELIRRSIPCTYFVSTDFVEHNRPFPHDVQRGKPLRPNSIKEIRALAEAGIQIGGHTRSHLDLGQEWSEGRLRSEICDSRKKLQDWSGQSVDYFAFPFGLLANISQPAIEMVVEAGYQAFVSAYGAWNFPLGDDFHLTRFHGDPCTEAIRNWLTFDPRRIRSRNDLKYQKPIVAEASPLSVATSVDWHSFPATDLGGLASEPQQQFL